MKALTEEFDLAIIKALGLNRQDFEKAIVRALAGNTQADHAPLKKLFQKALSGKDITIAAVGGSITEGAWAKSCGDIGNNATEYNEALGGEHCYAERVAAWFEKQFPNIRVTFVNAGIGATSSFLGAFRLDSMALCYQPDLVMVEFSVNDIRAENLIDTEIYDAYEAILRRCFARDIAVIQVFTVFENGESMQEIHQRLGEYYAVPMISYKDAVYPNGKLITAWRRLSPDGVHPNNAAHALIARLVTAYLTDVLQQTNSAETYAHCPVPEKWLYQDTFYRAEMLFAKDFPDSVAGSFSYQSSGLKDLCAKWGGAWVCNGGEPGCITLTVPKGAKRVFLLTYPGTGSGLVQLGNRNPAVFHTKTTLSFNKAAWFRVYTGAGLTADTSLEIESNQDGDLMIIGVLMAY